MSEQTLNPKPKYPQIVLDLYEVEHNNAFEILGEARALMRDEGIDQSEREAYINEATSGDHDHLVEVTKKWFTVV